MRSAVSPGAPLDSLYAGTGYRAPTRYGTARAGWGRAPISSALSHSHAVPDAARRGRRRAHPGGGAAARPGTPPPAAPPYQRPPGKVPLAFVIPSQQVPAQGLDLSRVAKEMLGGRRGRRRSWGPCQESGAGLGLAGGPGCGTTGPEAGPRQSRRRVDEHRLPGLTRTQ